jgi:hypothetical protein
MRKTRSDKGTGTIQDRSAYNRAYGRIYRATRKQRNNKCECGGGWQLNGKPHHDATPVKWIGSEGICAWCVSQQDFSQAQSVRRRSTLGEAHPQRHRVTEYLRRLAMLPAWLQTWTENICNQSSDIMLNRIESWIEDDGKEITVHGHGLYSLPYSYHLALTTEDCHV